VDLLERSGALMQAVDVAQRHVRQAFSAVASMRSEWSTPDAAESLVVIARALIPELDCLCAGDPLPGTAASPLVRAS
jgi:hypothetical protein